MHAVALKNAIDRANDYIQKHKLKIPIEIETRTLRK